MSDEQSSEPRPGRLGELRASARGWQSVQLAVLGFIGLCGVLKQSDTGVPKWIQILAGVFALTALALACVATYLIGRAAFPLYRGGGARSERGDDPEDLPHTSRRLIQGLTLTFIAVALTALAATSAWWPDTGTSKDQGLVELQTAQASVCGTLSQSGSGELRVVTHGQTIAVPVQDLTGLVPVDHC
jgi:hypothetical protein